jgi:hypothetical protein
MAYIVSRPDRDSEATDPSSTRSRSHAAARYEIRESISTPAGPRARTLATFRVLTADVIAHAASRAQRPFDSETIRARAAALGVPRHERAASTTAGKLLAQLRAGEKLPPALARELRAVLPNTRAALPDSLAGAVEWIGADDEKRGRTLRDLLDVASRVPARPRPTALSFPRLSSDTGG